MFASNVSLDPNSLVSGTPSLEECAQVFLLEIISGNPKSSIVECSHPLTGHFLYLSVPKVMDTSLDVGPLVRGTRESKQITALSRLAICPQICHQLVDTFLRVCM